MFYFVVFIMVRYIGGCFGRLDKIIMYLFKFSSLTFRHKSDINARCEAEKYQQSRPPLCDLSDIHFVLQ